MYQVEAQFEVSGFHKLSALQRAHFEASLLRHFLRFGAVAGSLQAGDSLRLRADRADGHPDLLLQLEGERLRVSDLAPPGRSLLGRLRGFLRTYPRPVSFPPLSLRALDGSPRRRPRQDRVFHDRVKVRVRLLGERGRMIANEDWLRALLPALWDDADLAAAVAAADTDVRRLATGSPWWYPLALDGNRCALLIRLGVRDQPFDWEAKAEELTGLCDYCLAWLRSVPAAPLPGPPFLVRGSAAFWQCPQCGGLYEDDPTADKAGRRAMLSARDLRERCGVAPPRPLSPAALPEGLSG